MRLRAKIAIVLFVAVATLVVGWWNLVGPGANDNRAETYTANVQERDE